MKKAIIIILCIFTSVFSFSQTVYTVDNRPQSGAQFTNLQNAVNASSPGDIIYIHPSPTSYNSVTIDKQLTLVGLGHDPTTHTQGIKAMLDNVSLSTNATNTKITGLFINRIQTAGSGNRNNIHIVHNRVSVITVGGNDWIVEGNYIISTIQLQGSFTGLKVKNNFMNNVGISNYDATSIVTNNIFYTANSSKTFIHNCSSTKIYNNIFVLTHLSNTEITISASTNLDFQNNLTYNYAGATITVLPGINNYDNTDPNFTTIASNVGDFYNNDYHLTNPILGTTPPPTGNIGVFGLNFPFDNQGRPNLQPYPIDVIIDNNIVVPNQSLDVRFTAAQKNILSSPNIIAAEYFIDTDTGVGTGINIPITSGLNINETISVPTTSLSNGLHLLHIRVKDANNTWSLYHRTYFFIQPPNNTLVPTNITKAEYFIDTDPGVSNGINIPITAGMTIDHNFTVPTAALTNGLHLLHIRVKDADNTWSLYHRSYFYIHAPNNTLISTNIISAEYFIDTDPGVGSATNIPITAGMTVDHNFTLPTAALTDGLHVLHIRVKDANNIWSLYHRSYFYIHAPNNNLNPINLVEAEYFIDNDPGVGAANSLAITNGINVDEVFSIPTGVLADGLHVLHIRVKDANNIWSLYHRAYFFIHGSNSNLNPTPIVDAEFFLDTDPGVGNGTPINVTDGLNIVEIFAVPIPLAYADGNHYLHVRAKDQDGTWSLYKRKLYVVDTSVGNTTCSGVTRTWTGVWDDGNGDNSPPTVDDAVIIDANYNTNTNGSIDACSCTINTGNQVIIFANDFVSLTNDLINNGAIEVKNNGSFAQFHQIATVSGSGTFKVERTTNNYLPLDYTYWSSPTQNDVIGTVFSTNNPANIYDFTTVNFEDLYNGNYPQTTGMSDAFDDNGDDWQVVSGMNTMQPGKGYIVQGFGTNVVNSETKYFNDTFNSGDINVPVTLDNNQTDLADNDNLIGNPYPSSIDAIALVVKNPLLSGTLYFWTHNTQLSGANPGPDAQNFSNNDYATWVAAGGVQANSGGQKPTDFIASCQGFFISVNATGTIKFENAMRLKTNNSDFFKTNNTDTNQRTTPPVALDGHQIWLNMTNDSDLFRQILIGFYDDATNNHDRYFDGKRLFSGNNFDFSSLDGTTQYAIQGFPNYTDERIVPLSIRAIQTGDLTISIDEMDTFFDTQNVYIRDLENNIIHDLKVSDYTFTINTVGENNTRFELLFRTTPLAVNDIKTDFDITIYPNPTNGIIHISSEKVIDKIEVYSVLGKKLLQKEDINTISLENLASGVYLLKIYNNNETMIERITKY